VLVEGTQPRSPVAQLPEHRAIAPESSLKIAHLSASVDRRLRAQTLITTSTLVAGLALAFTAGRIG
jgi:hypothetical protein